MRFGAGKLKVILLVVAGLASLQAMSPASAFDPLKVFKSDMKPLDIMRFGFRAYKKGNKDAAVGAFRYAATKNQLAAKWKLGKMYAIGDGVPRDEFSAFKLYREIADEYSEIRPRRRDRTYVADAVVAVADYYRSGIVSAGMAPNISQAVDYYYRAAALYGNRRAQYRLGRIYLDGEMGRKQPIQAARWLSAASKKRHPAAQAVLGRMLFEGNGVPRRRVKGLMLMTLAVGNNARKRVKGRFVWIKEWREKAFSSASEEERIEAVQLADKTFALSASRNKDSKPVDQLSVVGAPVSLLPGK